MNSEKQYGDYFPSAERDRLKELLNKCLEAFKSLDKWQTDAVLGNGEYDSGLMCGIEDRGYQNNGYDGMRYGYDSAIERVSEEIDGTISSMIKELEKA